MINWLLPITLFFSLSVRTPNTDGVPYDYEYVYSLQKGNTIYTSRRWEREDGNKIIDEEYWLKYNAHNVFTRFKYRKYTDRFNYGQIDLRYSPNNFSAGYAYKKITDNPASHNLVVGYESSKNFNLIVTSGEYITRQEVLTDLKDISYVSHNEAKFKLAQNLSASLILKYERGQQNYYLAKIGLEVKVPNLFKQNKEK